MIDCTFIGDSIAVGTHMRRPDCVAYAKSGINTQQWNRSYLSGDIVSGTVIISIGSNDHKHINTRKELQKTRAAVKASRVFWILPHGNAKTSGVSIEEVQSIVREIAAQHGDVVLPIQKISSDGVHPSAAGYKELARQTR